MTPYDVLQTVFDFRSFSSVWYWIAVAVAWSSSSHWVLGVPYDMVTRARRSGGAAADDLRDLTRINATRIVHIMDVAGTLLVAVSAFVLSGLVVLGFWYGIEMCQAIALLAVPMSVVGALSVRGARGMLADLPEGQALCGRLLRIRLGTQAVGLVAIVVTAVWGLYFNMLSVVT